MYNSGRGDRDLPGPGPSDIFSLLHPGSLRSFPVETDQKEKDTTSADTPNIIRQEAAHSQESVWLKGEMARLREWADAQRADLEAWKAKMEQANPSVRSERATGQKTDAGGDEKAPPLDPDSEKARQVHEDYERLDRQREVFGTALGLSSQKSEHSAASAEADSKQGVGGQNSSLDGWVQRQEAHLQEWRADMDARQKEWEADMNRMYPGMFPEGTAGQKTANDGGGERQSESPNRLEQASAELHIQLMENLAQLDRRVEEALRELGLPGQKSERSDEKLEAPATSAKADSGASTASSEAASRWGRWRDGFHALVGKVMHRSSEEATEVPATKEPERSDTEVSSDSSPGKGRKIALGVAALAAEWTIFGTGATALYQEVIAPHVFHHPSETTVTQSGAMDLEQAGRQQVISEKDIPIWEATSQGARFDGAVHVTVGRQEDGSRTVEIKSPFPLSLSGQPGDMVETIQDGRFDAKFPVSDGQGDFKVSAKVDVPGLALGGQPADQNLLGRDPADIFDSSELEPK